MELNWLECLVLGLAAGMSDALPVSAQAHKAIFLKIFGANTEPMLLRLCVHIAIFATLYYCCSANLRRIARQLRLSRVPKKKRKRPLDPKAIAEFKVLRIMVIPVVLSLFAYSKTAAWGNKLNLTAIFLLLNGIILYLPKLMPTGNKDALSMSALDSLLMGFGGGLAALPGVSSVGGMLSVASVCGAERHFALNMAYIGQLALACGMVVLDTVNLFSSANFVLSVPVLLCCLVAGAGAAIGTFFGVRLMRALAANSGFGMFPFYCFGAALFSFMIYLMV